MIEPHKIRLRGGWSVETSGEPSPFALPSSGGALVGLGPVIRLRRQFGHPTVRTAGQICRLVVRHVAGTVEIEVDGQKFAPAMPVDDHPEAGFDFELPESTGHRLTITVETAAAAKVPEWGLIWLEIDEGPPSTGVRNWARYG